MSSVYTFIINEKMIDSIYICVNGSVGLNCVLHFKHKLVVFYYISFVLAFACEQLRNSGVRLNKL